MARDGEERWVRGSSTVSGISLPNGMFPIVMRIRGALDGEERLVPGSSTVSGISLPNGMSPIVIRIRGALDGEERSDLPRLDDDDRWRGPVVVIEATGQGDGDGRRAR